MIGEIRQLYAYNRWANHRTLEAAGALSPGDFIRDLGSSFPSVGATLAHIVGAEWIWLRRWKGESPSGLPQDWDLSGPDRTRSRWAEVEREQRAFVDGLDDERLHAVISYRTTAGAAFEAPLWQLMRHVVNHSSYHRGQVATMLRQLGAAAPATDLVLFYREHGGGSVPDAAASAART